MDHLNREHTTKAGPIQRNSSLFTLHYSLEKVAKKEKREKIRTKREENKKKKPHCVRLFYKVKRKTQKPWSIQVKEKEGCQLRKLFTFHYYLFTGKSRKEREEKKDKNEERREQKEKATLRATFSFWWGMVDSNHRRRCQQIYSLSPLATREIPHIKLELVDGFEPPTC